MGHMYTPNQQHNGLEVSPRAEGKRASGWGRPELSQAENPVVFFSNGIGDSLLSLPSLRALSTLFAGRLTLVCHRIPSQLCYFALNLQRIVELEAMVEQEQRRGVALVSPEIFDARGAAAKVGRCDVFLSLVPWHSDCLEELVFRLIPHTTVGLFPFFDVQVRTNGMHASDMAFEIARTVDSRLCIEDYAGPPRLADSAHRKARQLRSRLPVGSRLLVVHPDTSPDRCWVPERYVNVLDAFLERRPEFFVFVVGRAYECLEQG